MPSVPVEENHHRSAKDTKILIFLLEDGKSYRNREGTEIVDIRGRESREGHYAYGQWIGYYRTGGHCHFRDEGQWGGLNEVSPYDLVEEVP